MPAINHWHPVLPASRLKDKPIGVRVAGGHEVVVFRTRSGRLGALVDKCPHRRMRLSLGKIEGETLCCPYHGWSFAPDGAGRVPSTPNAKVCARAYDVAERYGAIWVKAADSKAEIPALGGNDYSQIFCLKYSIKAPLELALDNFAEIEHSVTTHVLLAHNREGIAQTECKVDISDDRISIRNIGPQKGVFFPFRWMLGYDETDLFVGEGTIRFRPIYLELTNYWLNPITRVRRDSQMSGAVFFNPISPDETELMLFGFTAKNESRLLNLAKKALLTGVIHFETLLDKRMMEAIADKSPTVDGMKLGRFDRPMVAIREKVRRLYWGSTELVQLSRQDPSPSESRVLEA